jgi:hypothetical protein
MESLRFIDFEGFRAILNNEQAYADGANGERRPYDPVAIFKNANLDDSE